MEGLQLIATGGALPSRLVTNDDLSKLVDTSDEWITTRTGIRERHFCAEGENAATLAVAAARQALERSGLQPEQIGCCVCATLSGLYATPSTACLVQRELGLVQDIPVLDVNAACSGFIYGAAVALAERFQNVTFAPWPCRYSSTAWDTRKLPGIPSPTCWCARYKAASIWRIPSADWQTWAWIPWWRSVPARLSAAL